MTLLNLPIEGIQKYQGVVYKEGVDRTAQDAKEWVNYTHYVMLLNALNKLDPYWRYNYHRNEGALYNTENDYFYTSLADWIEAFEATIREGESTHLEYFDVFEIDWEEYYD